MHPPNQRPLAALNPLAEHYLVPCTTAHILSSQGVGILQHELMAFVTCAECLDNNRHGSSVPVNETRSFLVSADAKRIIEWKRDKGMSRDLPRSRKRR